MSDENVMLGRVVAEVTADTTNFDAGMKHSEQLADATSSRIVQTAVRRGKSEREEAKRTAEAEALYAKVKSEAVSKEALAFVAAAQRKKETASDLRKVQQLAAEGYDGEEVSLRKVAAAKQADLLATIALKEAYTAMVPETHAAVSEMQASSAAIRTFEGNPGIRVLERFATTIPGLGAAFQALFPIIGGVFALWQGVKVAKDLYDIRDAAIQATGKIREGFAELHERAAVANDDLEVQNSRLQDEILKLGGHPGDGLATALTEAKKRAEELLVSLRADRKELEALLKANSVSLGGSILTGVESTGTTAKQVLADQEMLTSNLRKANQAYLASVAGVKDPAIIKEAAARRASAIHDYYQQAIDATKRGRAQLLAEQSGGPARGRFKGVQVVDNSAKIAILQGREQQLADAQARATLEDAHVGLSAQVGQEKGAKQGEADADKAARVMLKNMEEQLAETHLLRARTLKEDYDFWDARRNIFKRGSEEFNAIVEKQAALAQQSSEKAHALIEAQKKREKEADGIGPKVYDFRAQKKDPFDADSARLAESNQIAIQDTRNRAKLEELRIQEQIGKTITNASGAAQLAAIHAKEYADQLAAVALEIQRVQSDGYLTEAQKSEKLKTLGLQQNAIGNEASAAAFRDRNAVSPQGSSYGVGAVDALNDLANASRNASSEMSQFVHSAFSDVNRNVVKDLMGQGKKGDWRQTGAGLLQNAAGSALKQAEGYGLKLLGFGGGKKGDSASNPLYVKMSEGIGGLAKQGFKGLFGPLLSHLHIPGIPGFAGGGDAPANSWIMTGEEGPELMKTGSRGATIIPNHMLGGGSQVIHIDARNADAAMVNQRVQAGMSIAYARAKADAMKGSQEGFRRSPR